MFFIPHSVKMALNRINEAHFCIQFLWGAFEPTQKKFLLKSFPVLPEKPISHIIGYLIKKTQSCYVTVAGIELSPQIKLVLNLQGSFCVCFPSSEITGVCYHTQHGCFDIIDPSFWKTLFGTYLEFLRFSPAYMAVYFLQLYSWFCFLWPWLFDNL